jgi:hypothetical protein
LASDRSAGRQVQAGQEHVIVRVVETRQERLASQVADDHAGVDPATHVIIRAYRQDTPAAERDRLGSWAGWVDGEHVRVQHDEVGRD